MAFRSPADTLAPRLKTDRYAGVRHFLGGWSELWGHSIFRRFGEMERLVPEAWFQYGATAAFSEQHALARGTDDPRAPESLIGWIRRLRELSELPRSQAPATLPSEFTREMTAKKRHEVAWLLGFFRGEEPARILDIGGGAGHLARHLALGLDCPVDSIDRNRTVQGKGLRIQGAYPWRGALNHPVRLLAREFPGPTAWGPAGNDEWAVGLHTCGKMAWDHLALAGQGYSILNIGCCYEALDARADTQRSRFARERPLAWTDEALFHANRGGIERSQADFVFQQRVLRYRYSLHELLCHAGRPSDAVGSASAAAYSGSFSDYVRDRLPLLGLTAVAIEDFHQASAARVEKMRFIAFLRNLLARPLEIALLLDRALWMEETGAADVRLIQLFDPRVSPRNIALVVDRQRET